MASYMMTGALGAVAGSIIEILILAIKSRKKKEEAVKSKNFHSFFFEL